MGQKSFVMVAALAALALAGCGKKSEPIVLDAKDATSHAKSNGNEAPWEAERHSIPGGQVILADDPAFVSGQGWAGAGPSSDGKHVTRWTVGDLQVLDWKGPKETGNYVMKVTFWRYSPYPSEKGTAQYKFPGDVEWKSAPIALGKCEIEAPIKISTPLQPLHLELQIPTWVPADVINGSNDPRKLGADFDRVELRPEEAAAPTQAPAAAPANVSPTSNPAPATAATTPAASPSSTPAAEEEGGSKEAGKDKKPASKSSSSNKSSRSSRSRNR